MPAFIPYAALFIGIVIFLTGAVMWHFGTNLPENEDYVSPTKEDIKWGIIGVVVGLIIIALSVWSIFVHWT